MFIFQPSCSNPDQCSLRINPQEGVLYLDKPCSVEITFIPQQCGTLNDDWDIPCYIQNASQPIFLKLNAVIKGMNVEFQCQRKY